MDGDVHHGVHARLMERVVEGSDAGGGGSHTGICVPGGDGIADLCGGVTGPVPLR